MSSPTPPTRTSCSAHGPASASCAGTWRSHSPPRGATRVQVRLEYADPVIEIDITDDGQPGNGTGHRGPAGHGLAGMRERAALYGGAIFPAT